MPKFQVLRRVDAFVDYIAEVDAESAEDAALKAADAEDSLIWAERGVQQFDARLYIALDKDGCEIDGTQCGDF